MEQMPQNIVGAIMHDPGALTDAQVQAATREAFHPPLAREFVTVGGREVAIAMLPWGVEEQLLDIIAPYLRLLIDAAAVSQFEEVLQSLLIEARHDLHKLAVLILVHHWKHEPAFAADEQTSADKVSAWLRDNAHFAELAELVLAQVQKNKVADSLGKLWSPAVLGVRILRILNSLPSQLRAALPSSLQASASNTESTP